MQSQENNIIQKPLNPAPMSSRGVQLDTMEIVFAIIQKWWLILISALLCGAIAFYYASYRITPLYQTSAMVYVSNTKQSLSGSPFEVADISLANLNTSTRLVDTYLVLLKSRTALERVIQKADLPYSYEQLRGMISAGSVNGTEVFSITVTSPSPQEAEKIANTIADVLPEVISTVLDGSDTKIVDYAVIPGSKMSPSITRYTEIGMLIGAMIGIGIIVMMQLLDYKVHSEEYLQDNYPELPLLAMVPDITESTKKSYYYSHYSKYESSGSKKNDGKNKGAAKGKKESASGGRLRLIGANLNFASKEAYKRLRANLLFALSDVEGCRVIGVTSSMRGEGKSLSSINVAYSLAQAGHRVLMVEGDMRLPSLAYKMRLPQKKGLSDLVSTNMNLADLLQTFEMTENQSDKVETKVSFDLLVAGTIPPNPSELLGSQKMQALFEELKQSYDYVILDLPPVIAVSDALVASPLLDGMVFVVRHDYSEKGAIMEAMRQMDFAGAHVLGFVFNCVSEAKDGYIGRYRYRYGKKYYRGSYYRYGYSHSSYGYGEPHSHSRHENNGNGTQQEVELKNTEQAEKK